MISYKNVISYVISHITYMVSYMIFTNFVMSCRISYMIYAVLSPPFMYVFPL